MKQVAFFVSVVLICFSVFNCFAAVIPPLDDNFESYQTGGLSVGTTAKWRSKGSSAGAIADVIKDGGNQMLKLGFDTDNASYVAANQNFVQSQRFDFIDKKISVAFNIKTPANILPNEKVDISFQNLLNFAGSPVNPVLFRFKQGTVYMRDEGTGTETPVVAYANNQWYSVKLTVDTIVGTHTVEITDQEGIKTELARSSGTIDYSCYRPGFEGGIDFFIRFYSEKGNGERFVLIDNAYIKTEAGSETRVDAKFYNRTNEIFFIEDGSIKVDFTVHNFSETNLNSMACIAVFEGNKLIDISVKPVSAAANSTAADNLQIGVTGSENKKVKFLVLNQNIMPLDNAYILEKKVPKMVNVLDFGALPNDGNDDLQAIKSAVSETKKYPKQGAILYFPEGKYDLSTPGATGITSGIYYYKTDNIEIVGENAELIVHDKGLYPVSFSSSNNVGVKGITINWKDEYISQASVVSTSGTTIRIRINDEFPDFDLASKPIEALMDYDPVTLRPIANLDIFNDGSGDVKPAITKISPRIFDITLGPNGEYTGEKKTYIEECVSSITPQNTMFLLRHNIYGVSALEFNNCTNVNVENININSVPGTALHSSTTKDITLKNVKVKPYEGRAISTTADGLYFTFMKKGEINIIDSTVFGNGDDCLAVSQKFREITTVDYANNSVKAKVSVGDRGPIPEAGTIMRFYKRGTMEQLVRLTVKSAILDGTEFKIAFNEIMPPGITADDCMVDEAYDASVNVSYSEFGRNRSRGMVLSTKGITIDNVLIDQTGWQGIILYGDAVRSHRPGPVADDVNITNSTFNKCGFTSVFVYVGSKVAAQVGQIQKNINLVGNTFINDTSAIRAKNFNPCNKILLYTAGVDLTSINGGKLEDNTFTNYDIPAYVDIVNNFSVKGNIVSKPGQWFVGNRNTNLTIQNNSNVTECYNLTGYNTGYTYYNDMRWKN